MSTSGEDEKAFLQRGIDRLRPVLAEHGFVYEPCAQASSSGGPFATAHFRRGTLEIGLIVREKDRLGCPNYSEGHGYAGHQDLFWALGREAEAQLVPDEFVSYKAKDNGDPFIALLHDLEHVILPALRKSPVDFSKAVTRAHKKFQYRLSGRSG